MQLYRSSCLRRNLGGRGGGAFTAITSESAALTLGGGAEGSSRLWRASLISLSGVPVRWTVLRTFRSCSTKHGGAGRQRRPHRRIWFGGIDRSGDTTKKGICIADHHYTSFRSCQFPSIRQSMRKKRAAASRHLRLGVRVDL